MKGAAGVWSLVLCLIPPFPGDSCNLYQEKILTIRKYLTSILIFGRDERSSWSVEPGPLFDPSIPRGLSQLIPGKKGDRNFPNKDKNRWTGHLQKIMFLNNIIEITVYSKGRESFNFTALAFIAEDPDLNEDMI